MVPKFAVLVAVSLLSVGSAVEAQQFVLADVSYTHSADTTKDSHFYPQLPADAPKDWTKPVDYAHGAVHIVLDVLTKPAGDVATKFQICFEGTPSYACTLQSPTYTKPGRVEWDSPFDGFWYESTVDWSQGVKRMPLILKDTMNNKPAGDPQFMPTDLHVQVTLVAKGAKFTSPAAGSGAGTGGGAGSSGVNAGTSTAGNLPMITAGTGAAGAHSATQSGTSGMSSPIAVAGSAANAGGIAPTAAGSSTHSGCRSTGSSSSSGWELSGLLAFLTHRRRRQLRP